MNTESNSDAALDYADLTDLELQRLAAAYRERASRAIERARTPGTDQAARARVARRLTDLYLQADAELRRRDAARAAVPAVVEPGYDPAPRWLMVLVGVGIVAAVAALVAKAGVL